MIQNEAPQLTSVPERHASSALRKTTITRPDASEDLEAIRSWAMENAGTALAWALSAPGGAKRDLVADIVCTSLAQTHPEQGAILAEHFHSGCSPVLENIVHQWAARDEAAAYAFAADQPPGDPRDRLLSRVALARSKKDPAAAARLVSEAISPGEIRNEAIISVLHQWVQQDPASALAWVQLFPRGDLRSRAVTELESALPYLND